MYIDRYIENEIKSSFSLGKVLVIYGPRQVGKTTLINKLFNKQNYSGILEVTGDDLDAQEQLSSQNLTQLKEFIGNAKLLVIDEAQKINKIGINLKLIVDNIENIKIIATGSSSFELSNQIGEPLVGRKRELFLYPISQLELNNQETAFESKANLESRLVFGSYPEIITTKGQKEKKDILNSIIDGYLFKDLFLLQEIKKSQKIIDLLKLIAFQIGQEVSLSELADSLNVNFSTVERYLDLLEKVFIIKKVHGFSRNLRKEISKNTRFYFYDNGIRNALINNFNNLKTRNDVGQLWENYLFAERLKKLDYTNLHTNIYFWRTYDQKEIDLVEERDGKLYGFEFKWNPKKSTKAPKDWIETYDNASYQLINQDNYLNFIS